MADGNTQPDQFDRTAKRVAIGVLCFFTLQSCVANAKYMADDLGVYTPKGPEHVQVADLNGDGRQDIIVTDHDNRYIYFQQPDGTYETSGEMKKDSERQMDSMQSRAERVLKQYEK